MAGAGRPPPTRLLVMKFSVGLAVALTLAALPIACGRDVHVREEPSENGEARPAGAAEQPLPAELFGTWIHSREEDHDGLRVYRRPGFPLPPARGRDGIVIHADGRFEILTPGPGDGGARTSARWERLGPALLRVVSLAQPEHEELWRIELRAVSSERLELSMGR